MPRNPGLIDATPSAYRRRHLGEEGHHPSFIPLLIIPASKGCDEKWNQTGGLKPNGAIEMAERTGRKWEGRYNIALNHEVVPQNLPG